MFIGGIIFGYFQAIVILYILGVTTDILITYIELKVRIPVTEQQEKPVFKEPIFKEQADDSMLNCPEMWMNPDMTNNKRVEYIIDLMFEAGFRSRSTASREFKRIVGCTPSEYQKSISQTSKW